MSIFYPGAHSGCAAVLLLMVALAGRPACADAPMPVIGVEGFAIQVKQERVTLAQLHEIAALGFTHVRTGIWWDNVEFEAQGAMRWNEPIARWAPDSSLPNAMQTSFEAVIGQARRAGLKILATLYHGNVHYTGKEVPVATTTGAIDHQLPAPRTPVQIAAFARFAAATARHFSERHGRDNFIWSIWNEPNMDVDFPPKIDAAIFGRLLLESCRAIKQAVPGAAVIGPDITVIQGHGEGEIDYAFIRGLFLGANPLECIDGFSFHPYRPFPPDSAVEDYQKILEILRPFMRQAGRTVPLMVDEWGYTAHSDRRAIAHPDITTRNLEQAALFARMILVNAGANIPLTTWYEWQDSGKNPQEGEHGFGIVDYADGKKPAHTAAATLLRLLRGRAFDRRIYPETCGKAGAHFYLFRSTSGGNPMLAAWSDYLGAKFSLDRRAPGGPIIDALNRPLTPQIHGNRADFVLSPLPRYIELTNLPAPAITCANAR